MFPSRLLLLLLVALLAPLATVVATGSAAQARGSSAVLSPGDHGPRVVRLQRYLHVAADGDFGPVTRAAVIRWQTAHHRRPGGTVGRFLWSRVTGSADRTPSPSRGGDRVTSLNWAALARCESGGNPRAVNPHGYYGLYQFSVPTWHSVGGDGMPHHASSGEQTMRAQILYRRSGAGPWPNCGRHLFD